MSPSEFQHEQTTLKHSIILDNAKVSSSFDEVLVEILSEIRMGVVLDRNTSTSRTSWLAGMIESKYVLMVLDSAVNKGVTRVSLDIWCAIDNIHTGILYLIQGTSLGKVLPQYQAIAVSWHLVRIDDNQTQLVVELTSKETDTNLRDEDILFFVDYQGVMTERFRTSFPLGNERVSVAIDLVNRKASWNGNLDDPYIIIYVSDAEWKSIDNYHRIQFSWRDALIHQIENHLDEGIRFTGFTELSKHLNIDDDFNSDKTRMLFLDFCRGLEVVGCTGQRVSDHCSRAIILTGLVICFNPARGLTGYLDMITGYGGYEPLAGLGSDRTWREHLSGIVNLANDFKPTPVKLSGSRKNRKPGRPPMQLLPTTPPVDLFKSLVNEPEIIVCKLCRFYE
ncbi:MAG: hypothetical protein JW779_03245 [Candidatus Thorarchaeota archaeon]|nr:hypothetical protein [Candidatus Thorarchaeota archaeon]